jgi:decaprenylphospho-beta-D-ribofuranose 2-oxidase
MGQTVTLTGWGRIAPSSAELAEPSGPGDAETLLEAAGPARGLIARGLGRSYNNAAQCGGGVVVSTARLSRITELDPVSGLATCEAGVSLEQLMVAGLPAGWFVPVSPGTRQVTIGGAIAADVHGKNHHVAGSFARHVRSFDLMLPGGELRGRSCPVLGDRGWHGPDRPHPAGHGAAEAGGHVPGPGGHRTHR